MGQPSLEEILFRSGTMVGLSDGDLLVRFLDRRDLGADLAFEAIVARHGPMVLAACRRQLRNPEDAADAFQATFLILARNASSIRGDGSLGGWLHRVARHASSRARRRSALRGKSESIAGLKGDRRPDPSPSDGERDELREVIDEELGRLPGSFRAPLVLCYLEGLTHDEAAEQLRCPVGTVRSRLARGRDRLRSRLIRRGVVPASLLAESVFSKVAGASMPETLLGLTVKAASCVATGQGVAIGSVAAYSLMESVNRAMWTHQMRAIGVALLFLGLGGVGLGRLASPGTKPPAGPGVQATRAAAVEARGGWDDLKGDWDVVSVEDSGRRLDLKDAGFDECTIVSPQQDPKTGTGSVGWFIFYRDSRLFEEWPVERLDPEASPKTLDLSSGGEGLGPGKRSPGMLRHPGLYQVGRDELTFCLGRGTFTGRSIRPERMASEAATGTIKIVLKRRPADDLRAVRRNSMQGTWKVVSVEPADARPLSPEPGQTWVVGPDSMRWMDGDKVRAEFTCRRTRSRVTLEHPTAGKFEAFPWEEDRGMALRFCYGRKIPGELKADPAGGAVLVILKRLTDPPASAKGRPAHRPNPDPSPEME